MSSNKEKSFGNDIKDYEMICQEAIQNVLDGKKYFQQDAQDWCNNISEEVITESKKVNPELKFIVAVNILQKGNSTLHYGSASMWDPVTDGSTTIRKDYDDMTCFVNMFGVN